MIETILKSLDENDKAHEKLKLADLPESNINRVDTGFNDKYAYGVATRRVEMSRGNKQGNNAFTEDENITFTVSRVDFSDIEWMMCNNNVSLKEIK